MLLVISIHGHFVGLTWHAVVEFCVISLLSSNYRAEIVDVGCLSLLPLLFCLCPQIVWMLPLGAFCPWVQIHFICLCLFYFSFPPEILIMSLKEKKKRVGLNKLVSNDVTFVNNSWSNQGRCPVFHFNAEYFSSLLIHLKCLILLKKTAKRWAFIESLGSRRS